mgnify:CR=1 FL=1
MQDSGLDPHRSRMLAAGLVGEGEPLDATSDLFRRVLDEVVDQKLLAAEAAKRKLEQRLETERLARRKRKIILTSVSTVVSTSWRRRARSRARSGAP